jgi:deoxyribodipyrimidine photo-lyase
MEKILFWFRRDLRLCDNPALAEAVKHGLMIPFVIVEEGLGGAAAWWLYHSLQSLNASLDGKLLFFKGDTQSIIEKLFYDTGAKSLYFNRVYEPWALAEEKKLLELFPLKVFNGSLLWEPDKILKSDGTPYKIFTHFYRKGCLTYPAQPRKPLGKSLVQIADFQNNTSIEDLHLLSKVAWYKKFEGQWEVGETSSQRRATSFINQSLDSYKTARDFPAKSSTSRLSAALHWGELSPNQLWYSAIEGRNPAEENLSHFLSELGWREFSYNLLYFNPDLPTKNFQPKFDNFPWSYDEKLLEAWKNGQTGYPLIDAGMRELWETGFMHNRVRMVTASLLVKNLRINWRAGERVFWDRLVDADLANNAAGWQWVAGSGADAAPYFRIFNPTTQAEKFDPDGLYIRKYLPEIAHLSNKEIFTPWIKGHYIKPIMDLDSSRKRALELFKDLEKG